MSSLLEGDGGTVSENLGGTGPNRKTVNERGVDPQVDKHLQLVRLEEAKEKISKDEKMLAHEASLNQGSPVLQRTAT